MIPRSLHMLKKQTQKACFCQLEMQDGKLFPKQEPVCLSKSPGVSPDEKQGGLQPGSQPLLPALCPPSNARQQSLVLAWTLTEITHHLLTVWPAQGPFLKMATLP